MPPRKTKAQPQPARPTTAAPRRPLLRHWRTVLPVLAAIILAAVPFVAGKYMELLRDGPFDGGLNAYTAQVVVNGGRIYEDIDPSARPATLLVNVVGVALFGYSELGPKLIQIFMQAVALAFLFYTLRKLYGNLPAAFALVAASLFLSYPLFAKYGNVKEQYMIACMVVTAMAYVLHCLRARFYWPLLAGAAAANIIFFKPTGVSVMLALAVFVVVQPLLKRCTWRAFARDVGLLCAGVAVGLLPAVAFYAQQRQLPALAREVPGLDAAKTVLAVFARAPESTAPAAEETASAEPADYVSAARDVSTFAEQWTWVTRYYRWLIAPLALALTGLFCYVVNLVQGGRRWARSRRRDTSADDPENNQYVSPAAQFNIRDPQSALVLLFALWWILDMLFVWISPRAYVEYFLPLGASSAVLAAYALHCVRRWPLAVMATSVAACLLVDRIAEGDFPSAWYVPVAAAAVLLIATLAARAQRRPAVRILAILVIILASLVWSWPLIADFRQRVLDLRDQRAHALRLAEVLATNPAALGDRMPAVWFYPQQPVAATWRSALIETLRHDRNTATWQIAGRFIRANSQPDDLMYVWAWFPGIYVAAQRFTPARTAAEGNMHALPPRDLAGRIDRLVADLSARPPRYIVDSQKMEYPFYAHPVFDLWPRVLRNQQNQFLGFDMRMMPRFNPDQRLDYLPPQLLDATQDQMDEFVRRFTIAALTNDDRPGGALDPERAAEQAAQEAARHRAMLPLRRFVMTHYRPVLLPNAELFIFERLDAARP